MSQNARVAALTDELILSLIGFDADANKKAYKHARDIATKGLKPNQYNRTNQFEVQSAFKGLDEKFRVLNRDDLADGLSSRLTELEAAEGKQRRWIPEYLSLSLQLSDRPAEESNVEALELLRPPTPPPPLTWEEIIRDDPYSDEEIWKDIDYAADSSEDEGRPRRREKDEVSSPPTSIAEAEVFDPKECIVPIHSSKLSDLRATQFWNAIPSEETDKIEITELQAVRESLFMLSGLETSLYITDKQHSIVRVNPKYVFSHVIARTMEHLLAQLADIGRDLFRLRMWTKRPSSLPLIQTFEAAVIKRLTEYDQHLATLQKKYLVPQSPVAVSLLDLHNHVRAQSGPLLRLSQLVVDIEPQLLINPFIHLETLFGQVSLAQMTLEADEFIFFSTLFFECLQTYLKPIRRWMGSGDLGSNDETFFVFENDSNSDAASLWHDRFVLRRGQGDTLRSPNFLEPAASKIFNTGKSVVFLKELRIYTSLSASLEAEPRLDHETVCGVSEIPLSPFPELFQASFDRWIRSKYSYASTILRTHLFEQSGLINILRNLSLVHLGADGSAFGDFADAVFERLDSKQRGWNDRFLLTELARGIYRSVLARNDAEKLVVRSIRIKDESSRSVKGLGGISIDYALPWAIQNIVQRSALPTYQQIFTFILQTYRAKYLLQEIHLRSIYGVNDPKLRQLSFKLRARLIWFADILRSYLTETVVALSTDDMITAITNAEDIDEMSSIHIKYLARLQEQSLLADNLKPIHKAIISLFDLAVLFHDSHMKEAQSQDATIIEDSSFFKVSTGKKSKSSRRKSVIPAIVENESSGSDNEDEEEDEEQPISPDTIRKTSFAGNLLKIDQEFTRLLPFITAGLRNIGRVGAEPVWEMLAERLEWEKKKDRF